MHSYTLNVTIAPLARGGDVAGQRIFLGFSLLAYDQDVINDFVLNGEKLNPDPDELIDLLPLGIFNACPLSETVCVTRGAISSPWFHFARIDGGDEGQAYDFRDKDGRTVELCQTCGEFFYPPITGFDGECNQCAKAREESEAPQPVTLQAASFGWTCPSCGTHNLWMLAPTVTCSFTACGKTFPVAGATIVTPPPPLYIAYVVTSGEVEQYPSFKLEEITAWLKEKVPAAIREVEAEIGTGESPDLAAEFIASATTPDELRAIITDKYAIIGSVFNCGYTAHQLPLAVA